jgi:hypothetical protein
VRPRAGLRNAPRSSAIGESGQPYISVTGSLFDRLKTSTPMAKKLFSKF